MPKDKKQEKTGTTVLAIYDADKLPPSTRQTGAFADIRNELRIGLPVGGNKVTRVADAARYFMEKKGYSYNKAYSYVRNALEKDSSFKITNGVITRV